MVYLYQTIFYRPILNVLIYFYNTIAFHDFGLAIVLGTILIRLILFPLFHRSTKQQMLMQRIQPKIKKIQELHKDDRNKQAEALMALYKEHGVNPFSSFLLLLVQLPILIALNFVARGALAAGGVTGIYSFIEHPASINAMSFHFINLAQPSIILIILAAIAQYFQARLALYRDPNNKAPLSPTEKMAKNMTFFAPIITLVVFYALPAAVGLYWLTTSLFSIFQQIIINRHFKKGETAAI